MTLSALFGFILSVLYTQESLSYKQAYYASKDNGKPIAVYVTSKRCLPCREFTKTLSTIDFSAFNFATVEMTRQRDLANKLLASDFRVPQLIIYHKDSRGYWVRRVVKGIQDKNAIERFLKRPQEILKKG